MALSSFYLAQVPMLELLGFRLTRRVENGDGGGVLITARNDPVGSDADRCARPNPKLSILSKSAPS
jgi:hypothetical protein